MNLYFIAVALAAAVQAPQPATVIQQDSTATVAVQNNLSVPVTLFVEREIGDLRIGTVPADQTTTFALPLWLARDRANVRLFLDPEGKSDLASREFQLRPGAEIGVLVAEPGAMGAEPAMSAKLTAGELAETTITVDNARKEDVVMYVEHGEFDIRLGTVPAGSEKTLPIPDWLAGERASVEVFAHVVNGRDLASQEVELHLGAHLGLRIPEY